MAAASWFLAGINGTLLVQRVIRLASNHRHPARWSSPFVLPSTPPMKRDGRSFIRS